MLYLPVNFSGCSQIHIRKFELIIRPCSGLVEIRRIGFDGHSRLLGIKRYYPEPAVAAPGFILIVGQHLINAIAVIADADERADAIVANVSVEDKGHI